MERRDFIEELLTERKKPLAPEPEQFQNKALPDHLDLGAGSIAPYSGTWGEAQVKHLLRRTLFGFSKADLNYFKAMSMSDAVDYLLNVPGTQPSPPVNGYNSGTSIDPDIASGDTWVNGPENPNFNGQRKASLYAWSMQQILKPERHIREKMTVFLHNHFATETESVFSPIIAYRHHSLLRSNCTGNFKTLVKDITTDVAMLIYLNGYVNTKTAPDENYARELMELFTLGKSADSQYTEDDVKAAARVLTGWRINPSTFSSFFSDAVHDTGNKSFSAFFGNTVITGKTGANGAGETDELINMIFTKQDVVARHVVRALYRYFVYYVIDNNIETNVIIPLADTFKQNWELKPVLTELLKSAHFYDSKNMGCYIKNPLDVFGTFIKQFKVDFPSSPPENVHQAYYTVWAGAATSGMILGNPPNVSGWPAYYQAPQYAQLWLNSDTLPKRIQYTVAMMVGLPYRGGNKLTADLIAFANQCSDPSNPDTLIQESIDLMFAFDLSTQQKEGLKKDSLLFGQSSNIYWTTAWNAYINDPSNTNNKQTVITGLQLMVKYLLDLAENQLA